MITTAQPPLTESELPELTPDDHEAGFKEVDFEFRSGRKVRGRLTAPDHRTARSLAIRIGEEKDTAPVIRACLPPEINPDRLTVLCMGLVEHLSMCLAFGMEYQKKMDHLVKLYLSERSPETTDSTHGDAKPLLSAPDTAAPMSAPGASLESGSGSPS